MKNIAKNTLLTLSLALAGSQAQALTDPNCKAGVCTIFQVSIHLTSSIETPFVQKTTEVVYVGTEWRNYEMVVTRTEDYCTKAVQVPQKVYDSVINVLDTLDGNGIETLPTLTPAQQTVLLFYTTMMNQTLSFSCEPSNKGSH